MKARKIFHETQFSNPSGNPGWGWRYKCDLIKTDGDGDYDVSAFYTLFLQATNEHEDMGASDSALLDDCRTDAQAIRRTIQWFDDFCSEDRNAIEGQIAPITADDIANDPRL